MNILPKLPDNIFAKVMRFHSHPTADLVKQSLVFRFYGFENEYGGIHGSPFDRGRADAHYERMFYPHRWTNGNGLDGGTVYDLTPNETDAYTLAYFGTRIRRWSAPACDAIGIFEELKRRTHIYIYIYICGRLSMTSSLGYVVGGDKEKTLSI